MDEYINREALRDSVESIDWYSVRRGELITGAESSENALYKANDIYSAIDNAPTADVAKVRHGRWICKYDPKYGVTYITCSRCIDIRSIEGCYEGTNGESRFDQENYCPHCGAKMDGRR